MMMINYIMCTSKILTDLCFTKQKIKTKNGFVKLFSVLIAKVLNKHKEDCLGINGKQSVKLEEEIIEFENYFKQIPVSFKICADSESNLRGVESNEGCYIKKYQDHIPLNLLTKLFVLMIGSLSQLLLIEVICL